MCGEQAIPYDCAQVASKLRPVIGRARRLYVRAVATGTLFEVVGVETRQAEPARWGGPEYVENVYLLVRRVPVLIDDQGEAGVNSEERTEDNGEA